MSFREKTAWIAVVTTVVIWGTYFFVVWNGIAARTLDGGALLNLFLVALGVTLAVIFGLALFARSAAGMILARPMTRWSGPWMHGPGGSR